jgi:hypothetical protein
LWAIAFRYASILAPIGLEADVHKVFARTTWSALLAAAISILFSTTGLSHGDWPEGPHKEWFQNLQRPDNDAHPSRKLDHKSLFCCGAADVVTTKFKVELGGDRYPEDVWYAWLNDTWTRIPPRRSSRTTHQITRPISSCWRARSSASCAPRAATNPGLTPLPPRRLTAPTC